MARIEIDASTYDVQDGDNLLVRLFIAGPGSPVFLLASCAGFGGRLPAMRGHPVQGCGR